MFSGCTDRQLLHLDGEKAHLEISVDHVELMQVLERQK